jgi:hypothetical protein
VLGYQAVLQVTAWKLALVDARVFGVHASATAVPLSLRVANDLLGPALAAVPFLVLWTQVREGPVRAALLGNALALGFFAVLEPAYLLLELGSHREADFLLWPEVNYGAVAVILLLVAGLGSRVRLTGGSRLA